jgi:hypothetical protein
MRTVRFVTALTFFLLALGLTARAEDALDREITLVGRDETVLTVPQPAVPPPISIPNLDLRRHATPVVPPIAARSDSRADASTDWGIADPAGELPV